MENQSEQGHQSSNQTEFIKPKSTLLLIAWDCEYKLGSGYITSCEDLYEEILQARLKLDTWMQRSRNVGNQEEQDDDFLVGQP
ncbi:hypothetical protein LXL04_033839 [Taraxacum kok-saghyz]